MTDVAPTTDPDETVAPEPTDAPAEVEPVDPTVSGSDATPAVEPPTPATPASDPIETPDSPTSEPEAAPEVTPAEPVIPETSFHDTREKQAAIDAGVAPGLPTTAVNAVGDLERALDALKSWVAFIEDAVKRVRAL